MKNLAIELPFIQPGSYCMIEQQGDKKLVSVLDNNMRVMKSFDRLALNRHVLRRLEKEYIGYPRFVAPYKK
ncbi:MAG: hypothetical protein ABII27_00840 [bacterium]